MSDPVTVRPALPPAVMIREVGPRDGLQNEATLEPANRALLVKALARAGCRSIEAVSFVSERAVPAMAQAPRVLELVGNLEGVSFVALVPNKRGAEAAMAAGVHNLTVTVSASPAYNEKNVRMTIEQSVEQIALICEAAAPAGAKADAVISCAFGSPFAESVQPEDVAQLARRAVEAGCRSLTLADTTGVASPRRVNEVLAAVRAVCGHMDIGFHFHDNRGTALVNAYAALQAGATRFDTSVGGLGGSPFAPQAGGNLATEDLVALLDDMGISTGIDLQLLLEASQLLARLVGHRVASRTSAALGGSPGTY